MVLAIAMGIAVAVGSWLQQTPGNVANARRWTVPGPPCPALTAAAFAASPVQVRLRFEYDEVTFERAFGHVYCDAIHDNGGLGPGSHPACQFTSPAVLKVTTSKGAFYFFPSTGPATVAVTDDIPTCVRGGWFKGSPGQF